LIKANEDLFNKFIIPTRAYGQLMVAKALEETSWKRMLDLLYAGCFVPFSLLVLYWLR
jgi:hypothetical protein